MAKTSKKSASGNRLSREEKRILQEIERTLLVLDEEIRAEEQRVQEYMLELQRSLFQPTAQTSLHFTASSTAVRPAQLQLKETHNHHKDSQGAATRMSISAQTANLNASKRAASTQPRRGMANKKPRRKVGP